MQAVPAEPMRTARVSDKRIKQVRPTHSGRIMLRVKTGSQPTSVRSARNASRHMVLYDSNVPHAMSAKKSMCAMTLRASASDANGSVALSQFGWPGTVGRNRIAALDDSAASCGAMASTWCRRQC